MYIIPNITTWWFENKYNALIRRSN